MRNTKLTLLTFFATLVLLLSSCERDANFTVFDGESKLYVVSEITPSEKINVYVKTSIGANTDDEFIFPKQGEAKIVLFEDGIALENPGFRYNASKKAFVSQGSFRPKVGLRYSLEVSLSDNNRIKPIFGTTVIPQPDTLLKIEISNLKNRKLSSIKESISFGLKVDLTETKNNYFLLKVAGNSKEVNLPVNLREVVSESDGVYYSKHINGIFIDKSKINGNLHLSYETQEEMAFDEDIDFLDLELRTITNEAHQFYVAYSKQLSAQGAAIAEPVISYSNIESGLGLFTGYASSFFQVKFQ